MYIIIISKSSIYFFLNIHFNILSLVLRTRLAWPASLRVPCSAPTATADSRTDSPGSQTTWTGSRAGPELPLNKKKHIRRYYLEEKKSSLTINKTNWKWIEFMFFNIVQWNLDFTMWKIILQNWGYCKIEAPLLCSKMKNWSAAKISLFRSKLTKNIL